MNILFQDNQSLIDGSVYVPNPSEIAIHESRKICKFDYPTDLLVSLGTGLKAKKELDETNFV